MGFLNDGLPKLEQSQDFYGILASRMVGRFEGKVGTFGLNTDMILENSNYVGEIGHQKEVL